MFGDLAIERKIFRSTLLESQNLFFNMSIHILSESFTVKNDTK